MAEATVPTAEASGSLDGLEQGPFHSGVPEWLVHTNAVSENGLYWFSLLEESADSRDRMLGELRDFVEQAHSDARQHLRALAAVSLDPLDEQDGTPDPAAGYPYRLGLSSLKGYFGEVFAGIIAMHFPPFAEVWEIPAYLFRFHTVAFQQLERLRQGEQIPAAMPGRTGDDFLAFKRDDAGRIVKTLVGEAKCTAAHSAGMISSAHRKISDRLRKPVDTLRLVDVLIDRDDEWGRQWVKSLREFYLEELTPEIERCDLVSYVCGQAPVQSGEASWMPPSKPHADYSGGRRLHYVETQLRDIDKLVETVYGRTP